MNAKGHFPTWAHAQRGAGRHQDPLPGRAVPGPQGSGTGTTGHQMEARTQRVRHHLRRPHASRREPVRTQCQLHREADRPRPLHLDLGLLAEPGRGLVRHHRTPSHPPRQLPLRPRAQRQDPRLHRRLERPQTPLRVDQRPPKRSSRRPTVRTLQTRTTRRSWEPGTPSMRAC